jgi:hypothetical protein
MAGIPAQVTKIGSTLERDVSLSEVLRAVREHALNVNAI